MNGQILDYSPQTNSGLIAGDDGNRYNFVGAEWKDQAVPNRGMRVDFEAQGSDAVAIYRAMSASGAGIGGALEGVMGSDKTKVLAGLLGIFLGWAGVHKFYLGIKRPATIQLAVGGGGLVLALIVANIFLALGIFGIGVFIGLLLYAVGYIALMSAGILGLVEGIIYLTKSDEDFQSIYVTGQKQWL
jgi:hypothetical protein